MSERPPSTAKCPECGKGVLRSLLIDESFDSDLGDETVTVHARNVPVERCDQCGIELSGPAAARVRHEAICKTAGFFTPDEVKALRRRLNLSQEEFARVAGVGVATVSRVERGRLIQNRSTDNLFRLLAESDEARRLLKSWSDARSARWKGPCSGLEPVPVVGQNETDAGLHPADS